MKYSFCLYWDLYFILHRLSHNWRVFPDKRVSKRAYIIAENWHIFQKEELLM